MYFNKEYCLAFREWLDKPLGLRFVALENQRLDSLLPTLFGYHAVILGEQSFVTCLQQSSVKHKVLINPNFASSWSNLSIPTICARQDKLPIGEELVDLVYLAHGLEFNNNPHEVLREAVRILRPDGHLLITMFNPLSLWGIWRQGARLHNAAPWRANFITISKLKDWLALLGFDIMRVNNFGFCLPFKTKDATSNSFTKMSWIEKYGQNLELPFGAAYLVEASKRILPVTPIRPAWATERSLAVDEAAEPTV